MRKICGMYIKVDTPLYWSLKFTLFHLYFYFADLQKVDRSQANIVIWPKKKRRNEFKKKKKIKDSVTK